MLKNIEGFLRLGFGVFPVRGRGPAKYLKMPLPGSRGHLDAIWGERTIESWPTPGYGLVPPKGVLIVDIDTKPGKVGLQSWASLWEGRGPDPDTFTVRTHSGGYHLYFSVDTSVSVSKSESKIAQDIDIRGTEQDGYVVGPGTPGYLIELDVEFARAPDWLVELCQREGGSKGQGAPAGVAPVRVPERELRKLVTAWRRKGAQGQALSAALHAVLEGEAYAVPGTVYGTTRDLSYWLAREWPHLDRDWFSKFYLEPSWIKTWDRYESGRIDRQWVRCWDSAIEKLSSEKADRAKKRFNERVSRIRDAHNGLRDTEYTESELETFASNMGVSLDELIRRRLLIQCGREHYVWCNGKYKGPFLSGIAEQCREAWAALGDKVNVEKWVGKEGELALRSSVDIMRLHGSAVESVRGSFCKRVSHVQGSTFVRSVCPIDSDLPGEYSRAVDAWLRRMCGSAYEHVLDWLATVRIRDVPAPALWMVGRSGSGKTLLAYGLARLWGASKPVDMQLALSRFNDVICDCSLVLGDERIPLDRRGRPDVEKLKAVISDTTQYVEGKGLRVVPIQGCLRVICCANNESMLKLQKDLTNADLDALNQRIIFVPIPDSVKPLDGGLARYWLRHGTIAKHAIWLEQHRQVVPGRLACAPRAGQLSAHLLAHSPLHGAIMDYVAQCLGRLKDGFKPGLTRAEPAVRVLSDGKLVVNTTLLHQEAGQSECFSKKHSRRDLAIALEPLLLKDANKVRPRTVFEESSRLWYREMDIEKLIDWAIASDAGDEDECLELIEYCRVSEEQRVKMNVN